MSSKRNSLVKGPNIGKTFTTSSKKGTVAKKARFSFDAQTSGKAKSGNGQTGHAHHPAASAAVSPTALPSFPPGAPTVDSPIIVEKIKELLRIAQDQGYLTYDDINDALPDEVVTPEVLDAIYSKLRGFEVEIVEAPDLERPKPVE
ncbi:MAG: RNA polymerase sigma factor region1.1 domain-containing protein, partial [Verrucomicrobiota bacterium]